MLKFDVIEYEQTVDKESRDGKYHRHEYVFEGKIKDYYGEVWDFILEDIWDCDNGGIGAEITTPIPDYMNQADWLNMTECMLETIIHTYEKNKSEWQSEY